MLHLTIYIHICKKKLVWYIMHYSTSLQQRGYAQMHGERLVPLLYRIHTSWLLLPSNQKDAAPKQRVCANSSMKRWCCTWPWWPEYSYVKRWCCTPVKRCILLHCYQRWATAIWVRTSATPQYCGQPNRLRSCGLKKVAELWLRTFKIWLPQFRNFPQSPASPLLSCPFSSAQDGFKSQQKIFLESSVPLETENLP